MRISNSDLKSIFSLLLKSLEAYYREGIDIDVDYYWDIDFKELYDPYNEPKNITIGQLDEDWGNLLKLLDNRHDVISHDFKLFSNIIRAVSYSSKSKF